MTRQEAERAVKQYGGLRPAARALNMHHGTLHKALHRQDKVGARPAAKPDRAPEKRVARTLADFRAAYDKSYIIPTKIRAALKTLGSGWEYEVDFARSAGVSLLDLGRVRDQFAAHVVTLNRESKRAWAGTKSVADAMRKML